MPTRARHPSYYVVKPDGKTARVFATVAQAATALAGLGDTPASICVVTGSRVRRLNQIETRELRRRVIAREHSMPNGPAWTHAVEAARDRRIRAASRAASQPRNRDSASI